MDIRSATADDLNNLRVLQQQLNQYREATFASQTVPFHARVVEHRLYTQSDIETVSIFVACVEERVVGYVAGSIFERPQHVQSKGMSIDELFVVDEYRHQGVACVLMDTLEASAKEQGCVYMTVSTDYENMLSRSFYGSVGMQEVTVELYKEIV